MTPVALTIAGSDPSGGAGIQADLKTFHHFGVYGEAVITLLTVQNTRSVERVELVSQELITAQIAAVAADIPPQAAKTGALGGSAQVEAAAAFARSAGCPIVVDPVMISKHGARLISTEGEHALREKLLPAATLVTPNIAEAEILSGLSITNLETAERAASRIIEQGVKAVLIKGGHLPGAPVDILLHNGVATHFPGRRIETRNTHGTGCTYSAAITALLARGKDLLCAVRMAKAFLQRSIETAPGLGAGSGPVNHFAEADRD